ncbi:MAG: transcription elongation factor GreA [Phycisphaerales bacterium]|nr:transcription elongation factor GreA [Phycisphaerales bacterium]
MEFVSKDEKARLEKRLRELLANRSKISERIAEARDLGDLKENAEYHSAREQQGLEEAEIRRLEERLQRVQVIEDNNAATEAGVVFLGTTVRLRETDSGDEDLFRLVGEAGGDDEDVVEVTLNSPMGEALMKARVGEKIKVRAPRGVKEFEIVEIV